MYSSRSGVEVDGGLSDCEDGDIDMGEESEDSSTQGWRTTDMEEWRLRPVTPSVLFHAVQTKISPSRIRGASFMIYVHYDMILNTRKTWLGVSTDGDGLRVYTDRKLPHTTMAVYMPPNTLTEHA